MAYLYTMLSIWMKKSIAILFLFSGFAASAQGELPEDSLSENGNEKYQVYVALAYTTNQFVDTYASFLSLNLGFSYNRHIEVCLYYSANIDDFKNQIIFPAIYDYAQNNYGINAHYSFFDRRIRPYAGLGFQFSSISWLPENGTNEKYLDYIHSFKPYIGVEWSITKSVALLADGGYMITSDVELIGFEQADYNGLAFNIMIKAGFYNW